MGAGICEKAVVINPAGDVYGGGEAVRDGAGGRN